MTACNFKRNFDYVKREQTQAYFGRCISRSKPVIGFSYLQNFYKFFRKSGAQFSKNDFILCTCKRYYFGNFVLYLFDETSYENYLLFIG